MMRIRETTTIVADSPSYYRAEIEAAIAELEEDLREGRVSREEYLRRKRALVRML